MRIKTSTLRSEGASEKFLSCRVKGGQVMTNAERDRAIQALEYYGEKLGCKAEFDLAIKALKFVDENCPKTFTNYLNGKRIFG